MVAVRGCAVGLVSALVCVFVFPLGVPFEASGEDVATLPVRDVLAEVDGAARSNTRYETANATTNAPSATVPTATRRRKGRRWGSSTYGSANTRRISSYGGGPWSGRRSSCGSLAGGADSRAAPPPRPGRGRSSVRTISGSRLRARSAVSGSTSASSGLRGDRPPRTAVLGSSWVDVGTRVRPDSTQLPGRLLRHGSAALALASERRLDVRLGSSRRRVRWDVRAGERP